MTTTTLSVVQYSNNNTTTSPQKINNILQQSTAIINNKAERIIIVRKPQPIAPATKEILLTNKAKKQRLERSKECIKPSASSAPVAVARRNARERNRVKQVNNGFATLRQHIPEEIAVTYESGSKGGNKKLSKVETLRMAVEYIRNLEDILAADDGDSSLLSSYASSSPSSPTVTTTSAGGTTYTYPLILSPCQEDDDLFSIGSTPPPSLQQQFIRLGDTSAYDLLESNLYDDSENLEPLDMNLVDTDLMDTDLGADLLNSISTGDGSLSPSDIYSDESLSPLSSGTGTVLDNQRNDNLMFIPLFNSRDLITSEELKFRISPAVTATSSMCGITKDTTTIVRLSSPLVTMLNKKEEALNPQLLLKMEPQERVPDEESKENNMIQVMAWWQEPQEQDAQTRS